MTRLSVNLNKVALVRNQRPLGIPGVARLGAIALAAGARGLTLHPRPDGRPWFASSHGVTGTRICCMRRPRWSLPR